MRSWMKVSLLIVLVLGLCWGGAIWFWRATNRMPAAGDMVAYLLALPVGILLGVWIGRVVMQKMAAAPATPEPSTAPAAAAAPAGPVVPPLAMLAAFIRTPHGADLGELSGKLQEGQARGELDATLVDEQGFPVMTQRSLDADDSTTQEEISAWFAGQDVHDLAWNAEQWRALTLASAVTAELASRAITDLFVVDREPPMLYLQPILPLEWDLSMRGAAGLWLKNLVLQAGWPDKRLSLATPVPTDARGSSPAAVLGRIAHQANTSGMPMAAMVVACASHLSEECIEQWAAQDIIFSATRPQGLIPGEGAAGMLLADAAQAAALPGLEYTLLHHEPEARRHNSADEAKKADAKALETLADKLLATRATEAGAVAMLVTDTDHRTSRVLETMALASGVLPHLDVAADVLLAGAACGSCGPVPFVTALALAHHHATELEAPVLCISNDDPYRRSAILIKPAAALS